MDKFDKLIKEAVEGYEAPYDAQAWANVSKQINSSNGGAAKWIIGSLATVAVVSTVIYFNMDNNNPATENEPNKVQEIALNDNSMTETNSDNVVRLVDENSSNSSNDGNNQSSNSNEVANNSSNPNTTQPNSTNNNAVNNNSHSVTNTTNTSNNSSETNSNSQESNSSENTVVVKSNARFYASSYNACSNTNFVFTPEDGNQNLVYVWDFGDGSYSNSKIGTHSFTRAGVYQVTLSMKDATNNKTLSKSSQEITVNPLPAVNFSWEQPNSLIPTINFINLTEDAQTFGWDIKGIKTTTDAQLSYTFRKKGTYLVELTASNEYGCVNSVQKPIEVKNDYNLLAPTAFTPNGDGKNDYFIPEALKIMDAEFTMVIYDKSGSIMYQTNEVSMPWDGTNMTDNSVAEDGAYVWKVQLKNNKGETEYYEGHVIITR